MKYLIREVGWVFNDSTYDNDGNYRTVKIFDSEDEAKEKKKELDFEHFIHTIDFIHRYESYGDYRKNFRDYKLRVAKYLTRELNLNPTIQLIGHNGYSTSMFLKELTPEIVQKILEIMNIDFFSIIAIEEANPFQYEVKLNPFYEDGREEYLWDYHGNDKLRFDSKFDAVKRFLSEEYHFNHFTFERNPKLTGLLSEISALPDILSLIHI